MARAKHTIGRRRWRITLCRRQLASPSANGEEVESWPDPTQGENDWWASLDGLTAGESIAQGIRQTTEAIRLRLPRQFPGEAIDRVRNRATGLMYSITSVDREDIETVITIERVARDPGVLLMENGQPLLMEDGGFLLLEV